MRNAWKEVCVEGLSEEVEVCQVKQIEKVDGLLGKEIPNEAVAGGVLQAKPSLLLQSLPQKEAINSGPVRRYI